MPTFNPENITVPATDILAQVDSGEWDSSPSSAVLQLLAEWCKSQTGVTDLRFFRSVVTHMWIILQCEKNGSPEFVTDEIPTTLPLRPDSVRGALVTGLEMAIAERYSPERAETEILNFYLLMLDARQGLSLSLSPFGTKVLTDIHLAMLRDAVSGSSREVRQC